MKKFILIVITLIIYSVTVAQNVAPIDSLADNIYRRNYRDTLDSIVKLALDSCCFPGCQIFAAKNGKVIVNKAYGFFTYQDTATIEQIAEIDSCLADSMRYYPVILKHQVQCSDIYDIASLTKVAATTLMAMYLVDRKLLNIGNRLGTYLESPYGTSDVLSVSIRSLLEHRSGIKPFTPITRFSNWLPGWKINCRTLGLNIDSIGYERASELSFNEIFSREFVADSATLRVAENVWMKDNYKDSLQRFFFEHKLKSRKRYVYSDINMIYLMWAVENILKCKADSFMLNNFYLPLGMETTGYLPLTRFDKSRIAPTEPHQWSGKMLQGDVHDPTAAFLGGIAGNAGVFSSAQDLGKLFQMLLNHGEYNGKKFFERATVDRFTMKQPNTTRGLGFDMVPSSFASSRAGSRTFGHTGFTGCCAWADPDNGIVIVFLCNRIHPTQENKKINQLKIRQKVCDAIYDGCL